MEPLLDTLYAVRASLSGDFEYRDWTRCTCGHIYQAAMGERASSSERVLSPTGAYRTAVIGIARALGWQAPSPGDPGYASTDPRRPGMDPGGYTAALFLSRMTQDRAPGYPEYGPSAVSREDALWVVNEAIAAIEAEQEAARKALLGTVQSFIDTAALESIPTEDSVLVP